MQDLIDQLPGESATKTAVRDDLAPADLADLINEAAPSHRHGPWSRTDMLLAAVLDRLGWVVYATYHAQGGKPSKPDPYPRPGINPGGTAPSPVAVAQLEERRRRNREARLAAGKDDPNSGRAVRLDPKTVAALAARRTRRDQQQRG